MIDKKIKNQLISKICDNPAHGLFILDDELKYLWSNHRFGVIVGRPDNRIVGSRVDINFFEDFISSQQLTARQILDSLVDTDWYNRDLSIATGYGDPIDINLTLWRIRLENATYYVGSVRDIAVSKNGRQDLLKIMYYDRVTGLPNRTYFISQLDEYVPNTDTDIIIARVGIDCYQRFIRALSNKQLNTLLHQIVKRIKALGMDELKLFSYFGAADFVLLFEVSVSQKHDDDFEQSLQVINTYLQAIAQQFEHAFIIYSDLSKNTTTSEKALSDNVDINQRFNSDEQHQEQIYVHASIGVSQFVDSTTSNDGHLIQLLDQAEQALSFAEQSNEVIKWYDPSIDNDLLNGIQLETELRQGLEQNQFVPYFQPKLDLTTRQIYGFEALVRWQHPTKGLLTPYHFLTAIIDYRLSFDLYKSMVTLVAKLLADWAKMGFETTVCVNIDAAEFRQPEFLSFTKQTIDAYHLTPNSLNIEMTESSLMINDETSLNTIQALQNMGVSMALDDFGTGYASLSYLLHYPFDYIKIDQSFIKDITPNNKPATIVKSIISMALDLNLYVVAEGIENEQQAQILQEMGCVLGQGYYFGRPASASVAAQLLKSEYATK